MGFLTVGIQTISGSFAYLYDSCFPTGLPHPVLRCGSASALIIYCYAMYDGYTWEVCSFLSRDRRCVDLGEMGGDEVWGRGERKNFDLVYMKKNLKCWKRNSSRNHKFTQLLYMII